MAYQIGTTNLSSGPNHVEDLFNKLVDFVSTDPTLVAAGQNWTVLRRVTRNLAALNTNISQSNKAIVDTMAYDPRIHNGESFISSGASFYSSNISSNNSFFEAVLYQPREVRSIRIVGSYAYTDYHMRGYDLYYSDDGVTYTLSGSISRSYNLAPGQEVIDYFPAVGPHKYWKVVVTATWSNYPGYVAWSTFLMFDGAGEAVNLYKSEVFLKGPGASGTDEIFVGIRTRGETLFLNGYTGYDNTKTSWFDQPGALNQWLPVVPAWGQPMPYWFVATGRAIRFATKVSTVYESGYLGFLRTYSTPGQYPYPLAIGGSGISNGSYAYSAVSYNRGVYCMPGGENTSTDNGSDGQGSLSIRFPEGSWRSFCNYKTYYVDYSTILGPRYSDSSFDSYGLRTVWPHCVLGQHNNRPIIRPCTDGAYLFTPCIPVARSPAVMMLGELEGTYHVSGVNNASENTAVVNGKTYVIFHNTYRITSNDFWALSLD